MIATRQYAMPQPYVRTYHLQVRFFATQAGRWQWWTSLIISRAPSIDMDYSRELSSGRFSMGGYDKVRRAFADLHSHDGRRSLAVRFVDRLSRRIAPELTDSHLLPGDIVSDCQFAVPRAPIPQGHPLRIGWVISPPIGGSGGHTTAFRMVQALESAGHKCELLLYDPFGGDVKERERVIRAYWPWIGASVRSIDDGFEGFDVCIATGWQSAHALGARSARNELHRMYFVQDFEPMFYPRGFEYVLAEMTYRFGFQNIALGRMVAHHLSAIGADSIEIPFGCDTDTYQLLNGVSPRSGVVFYSRAGTSRRGFLLATMALAEFNRRRPGVPIKAYGPARADLNFPVDWQGLLRPAELCRLYNSSICGIGLSFTNVSLVVGEMLASGCVPLVNDSIDGRLDMTSPEVAWVHPTPSTVADALVRLVDDPPDHVRVANSVGASWSQTATEFVGAVERTVLRSVD